MASPTPGYCTLTATARSSPVAGSTATARWTWPIDAAAIGSGSHSTNSSSGGRAELALDDLGGQLGAHRRRVGLQRGERLAHRFGQAVVEVAGHLADLHQRALHVAEALGDLLGACAAGARRRARRGARRRRTACGRRSWRTSTRRRAPRRASSRLRPARDVRRIGPIAPRRRDGRTARRDSDGRGRATTAARRLIGARRRRASATVVAAPASSTGTKRSGRATTASWPPSTRNARAVGMRLEQPDLAAHRHDLVAHRDDHRRRHVDLAEPVVGAERADRPAGLEHHAPVVLRRLLDRPRRPRARLALEVQLVGQPAPRLRRREPGQGGEPGEAEERQALVAARR